MVTQYLFIGLVFAVVVQRLLELRLSRQHETLLRSLGAKEHAAAQMRWMTLLHGTWIVAMLLEVIVLARPFRWQIALLTFVLFCLGQGLRLATIATLGSRWTVKILTLPGTPPVTNGIFRWLRHPNYLGVVLEIAALPLVHGAWITALVFTLANALLLQQRIRAEERALEVANEYGHHFKDRPRFIPGLR